MTPPKVGVPGSQSSIPLVKAPATNHKTWVSGFRGGTERPSSHPSLDISMALEGDVLALPPQQAALGSEATSLEGRRGKGMRKRILIGNYCQQSTRRRSDWCSLL